MNLTIHSLLARPLALFWLLVTGLFIFAGIFAPLLSPHDPLTPNLAMKFASFSLDYPLGSDHLGRCILSRLLYGVRTTLFLSMAIVALSLLIALVLGLSAAFFRRAEEWIMRACDAMLSFPSELMFLAIVGMLGPGILNTLIAGIIAKSAWHTRMIYAFALHLKDQNYLLFAQAAKTPLHLILRKHLWRALSLKVILLATMDIGWMVLSLSALSFLGLGVQAPTPEWGVMLSEAKEAMSFNPIQMLPPGMAILLIVLAFNFWGDTLQTLLDPKHSSFKGHS